MNDILISQLDRFGYGYETLKQKLNYLHDNPVRAGIVYQPCHYKYSSAVDYSADSNSMLELALV
ncbi:MAG: hypothetical protein ACR2KZ_12205 [Segetibacter sp.]